MPEQINQVTAGLLILSLACVLAMAMISLLFVRHYLRRRSLFEPMRAPAQEFPPSSRKYRPSIFEQPCRWMVVKSSNAAVVQAALGLHKPTPCSWGDGLSCFSSHKLFVSAPVNGWILVAGQALPDPSEDVDECYLFIARLSRELGQVQFFSANRALNHHAWARAENGLIRRAYAWAGETLWSQGPVTPAETSLGLKCYDYTEKAPLFSAGDSNAANAERVAHLAARWSFDPSAIDENAVGPGQCVSGELTHLKLQ